MENKNNSAVVGYRVNLDNFISNWDDFLEFLNLYYGLFNFSEIKLNHELCTSELFTRIINYYLEKNSGKFSIHISKNYLIEEDKKYENQLFSLTKNKHVRLVTHFPELDNFRDFSESLIETSKNLPLKNVLLLENPILKMECLNFFEILLELIEILKNNNIENIRFCLDIGHLLLVMEKQKISQEKMMDFFINHCEFFDYVDEFHFHNVLNGYDHQPFYEECSTLNFSLTLYNFSGYRKPIIVETKVKDIQEDGIKQIKLIREGIQKWKS